MEIRQDDAGYVYICFAGAPKRRHARLTAAGIEFHTEPLIMVADALRGMIHGSF
jgi:hypothetical protein